MSQTVLQLKPEQVNAQANGARFDLNPAQVESLADSILSEGGVLQPVGVLAAVDGTYPLVYGFHRHAAVESLNKNGAGLTLPAIVLTRDDATAILKTQIAENNERQELSPMDKAIAMKGLLDKGVSRKDVRTIFAVPGGRKGASKQPLSNAALNIHLRFLELPKTIQEKIHSGSLTWAAAYELGRVTPDKRAEVLKRAEEQLSAQLEKEERDEKKYLDAEAKLVTAEKAAADTATELDRAKQAVVDAQKLLAERTEQYREVQKEVGEVVLKKDAKDTEKKTASERLKAAETDLKGAEKAVDKAKDEVEKLSKKTKTAKEKAEEIKEKLEAQRKALKNKKPVAAVGPKDVKKAAAETEGANHGYVPLTMQAIRELIKDGCEQKDYPKVSKIFAYLRRCTDGISTPKECISNIALITGENTHAPAPAKKQ